MRHVDGTHIVDFAEIYDEAVELVTVTMPITAGIASFSNGLMDEADLQAQWFQGGACSAGHIGSGRKGAVGDALAALSREIDTAVEVLKELLGCASCGVRVKVLDGPMCPRFHVDRVPCRMIITYVGAGTEWIAHGDVDQAAVTARHASPVLPGSRVRRLGTGAWSLLKGGAWDEGFRGVVHRSPSTSERRLLVSLDPIFSD